MRERYKRVLEKSSTFQTLVMTMTLVVTFLAFLRPLSPASFWNDFLSSFLSTVVGLVVGIPIALFISEWQENASAKERTHKILSLLYEELQLNHLVVSAWLDAKNIADINKLFQLTLLHTELWSTFSDGGEIQWVKDLGILSALADAYQQTKTLDSVTNRMLTVTGMDETSMMFFDLVPSVRSRAIECRDAINIAMDLLNEKGYKGSIKTRL